MLKESFKVILIKEINDHREDTMLTVVSVPFGSIAIKPQRNTDAYKLIINWLTY